MRDQNAPIQAPACYLHGVPSWISEDDAALIAKTAAGVPAGGLIVEVGSLYGASTAVLALAQPDALVVAIDPFLWSPLTAVPASADRLIDNVREAGAHNVVVIPGDSHEHGRHWLAPIDLLFVDGDHSYEGCREDLYAFGPFASVVMTHDFGNGGWPGVERATREFCAEHGFAIAEVSHMTAVLRRVP